MLTFEPPTFSDEEFDLLEAWLMRRSKGITDIVELEGFLTAVVVGPVTLVPSVWLPKVLGGKNPGFRTEEEFNEFARLVMGFYNVIVAWFDRDPAHFQPTFYERHIEGKRIFIVDEWCWGFMKGVRLNSAEWKPLKRDQPELLRPMELFGTTAGLRELDAGGADVMHGKWSRKITPAVRAIHAYWLPKRHADHVATRAAMTVRRDGPKVGRNDVCPCGSGRKYKQCCGQVGGTVH
jgi:uncharacterized protein